MYRARNIVLACTGRVKHARVVALARRYFGAMPAGRTVRDDAPHAHRGPTVHLIAHDESPQTVLRANFLAVPESHADFAVLRIVRRVLDDGLSSRLPFQIVEQRGLAYDVRAEIDPFADVSIFEIEAATTHANVTRVLAVAGDVLGDLIARGPTPEELARAVARHRIGLEFAMDSPGELAGLFGRAELWRRAEPLERQLARFAAVTRDDVRRVCARTFARGNLHLVLVGRGGARVRSAVERVVRAMPLPN
jgi:predicted Zn-dependent peptidase